MTPLAAFDASQFLAGLIRTVLFGAPLVAAGWAASRFVPVLPPRARAALWWLVTLRLVLWLVPMPSIALPILPAPQPEAVRSSFPAQRVALAPTHDAGESTVAAVTSERRADVVTRWALAAWISGLSVLGAFWVLRVRRLHVMLASAIEAPASVEQRVRALAIDLGLGRVPSVRISPAVSTPLVTSPWRPVIVLPARSMETLREDALDMVLCHELLHVRHHDLWLGLVPAAAEWLLYFNPLARLAAREYALAREAACDARVLEALGVAPRDYGRLLLALGPAAPGALIGGVAATGSFTMLKRRLTMLDSMTRPSRRRGGWAVPACAALVLLPVTLAARPAAIDRVPAPAHAAMQPIAHAETPEHAPSPGSRPEPMAAAAPQHSMHIGQDDHLSWVLFTNADDDVHMEGSNADVRAARAARRGREPMLWVRREGRQFVIRDAETLEQVRAIFAPVEALGRKQAEIGSQQAAIGAKMASVGQEQAAIGARQAAIGSRQAELGSRQAAAALRTAGRDKPDAALERQMKDLETQMDALGKQMDALGQEMEAKSKPMEDLSKEMEPLSAEQEKLGAQMEALADHATADMERLVDKAIASAIATEIK